MATTAHAVDYHELLGARRALGERIYGDLHLSREDLPEYLVHEICDAYNYLRFEWRRWDAHRPELLERYMDRLGASAVRCLWVGQAAEHVAVRCGRPVRFLSAAAAREYANHAKYGAAYLRRDNLAEALEELADAQIACDLALARFAARGGLSLEQAGALRAIHQDLDQLAARVWRLREAAIAVCGGDLAA